MKTAIKLARAHFELNFPKPIILMFLMSAIVFAPNYPRIVVACFVVMPVASLFGFIREHRTDDVFSALPVRRAVLINGQTLFAAVIEMIYVALMAVFALFSAFIPFGEGSTIIKTAVGMKCTPGFFGVVLSVYGVLNLVLMPVYFKGGNATASRAFVSAVLAVLCALVPYALFETLSVIFPAVSAVFNSFGAPVIGWQLLILAMGSAVFVALTFLSAKLAVCAYKK